MSEQFTGTNEPHAGTSEGTTPVEKRRPGGQPGNVSAVKDGISSAKAAMTRFGMKAINKRTRSGKEHLGLYVTFLSEATGISVAEITREDQRRAAEKKLTKVEVAEIESLAMELWMVRKLDAEINGLKAPLRTKTALLSERDARLASYERRRAAFSKRYRTVTNADELEGYV